MSSDTSSVRKSGHGARTIFLLSGGLLLLSCLGCGLCGGVFYLVFVHEFEESVTADDRAVVVTDADVARQVATFRPRPGLGKLKKVRHLDGSKDVEFEYATPEDAAEPFYILCSVSVERNVESAKGSYIGLNSGLKIGLAVQGEDLRQVEKNHLYRWGDESRCALLTRHGASVGTLFAARKGTRVFHLIVVGAYFDDAESLRELLDPVLKKFEAYSP